ncbi:DinB family protein [Paenibacillus sp.]|uniref:DinB family protein n=1 Tax=Paenibacillus sp. TaxID=58172 RepID=UPI002810D4EC|nr:DinB family protein [Paenibacillus sp.]
MDFTPELSLAKQFEMIYERNHWYAPLRDLLAAVTPDEAIRRPVQGGHTIYEIVHHLLYSAEEATHRLGGRPSQWDEARSWVETPAALTAEEWQATIGRYDDTRRAFRDAAFKLGDAALEAADANRPAPYDLVQQILHHEAFHAGQIAYIRRLHGREALL